MSSKKLEDHRVDVSFESHPPIESDLDGITTLLKQTLLQFVDCKALANYLIELKNTTQIIALESPDEENIDQDDEPDDDIYGVTSVINLPSKKSDDEPHLEHRKKLAKFLGDKCPTIKDLLGKDDASNQLSLIINERFINLPPQLALPTLQELSQHIENSSHLVFIAKILQKSKDRDTKLPSKKVKVPDGQSDEHLIYINSEEEIIFENCDSYEDIDVSYMCDDNVAWSFDNDTKYNPYRRIMVVHKSKWPTILNSLSKELKQ